MAFDFVILGATGMQGRIAAKDLLSRGYSVLLCGRDKERVESLLRKYKRASFKYVDLKEVHHTIQTIESSDSNVVINCAEGDWNINAMKSSLAAGAHYIDLGSDIGMTKEQFAMDSDFKRNDLISITGCGSTPGINNIMLAHIAPHFDKIKSVEAGFVWDSNQKVFVVPFSIRSIIEEFMDPATLLRNGKFIKVTPRDYFANERYREIGKQKTFYVRHPEVYTFYEFLKRKGVKNIDFLAGFPEHSFRKIVDLIELGIESNKKVRVDGHEVHTSDFLAELLKGIKIPKGYKEKENLWIRVHGQKDRMPKTTVMECLVSTVKGWEDAGCNIDTGMPAAIIAEMIKKGVITKRGSFAPESVVPTREFFKELAKRKMYIYENGRKIN